MDGSQVGVLKESNEVGLTGFLKCSNGGRLESQVCLEILGNLTNETLEGELSDQELSRFLVSTNFTESDGSRSLEVSSYKIPVSVRLLDSTSSWCRLTGSLGCQLLSWCLSSSRFTCGLLGSCHFEVFFEETSWLYLWLRPHCITSDRVIINHYILAK
jgi:hypothetical protein